MRQQLFTQFLFLFILCFPTIIWAQEECPDNIWYTINDCHLSAEIGSFVEGEEVTWYFNDGTEPITGGHFIEHTYLQSGAYQLCAFYTSPLCPDGVELCTEDIIVQGCGSSCELTISVIEEDCNWFVLIADNYPEDAIIEWVNADNMVIGEGNDIAVEVDQNEIFYICAQYETPDCPEGVSWCIDLIGESCGNECPEALWYDVNGCDFVAEIGSFVEGEEVTWNFDDGSDPVVGGHYVEHTFPGPGGYQVTAFYTSPLCPDGVLLWTDDILIDGCDTPCELDVTVDPGDCNWWVFYADNYPENAILHWSVNGDVVQEDISTFTFQTNDNAVFEICAFYETPECPEGVFWCTTVEGTNCEGDCPEELWYDVNGCDFVAEIGSFVEGEEVTWNFYDGSDPVVGGHYVEHTFPGPGGYQVTAFYTSPLCPDGVLLWTDDILIDGCDNPCELDVTYYEEDCNWYVFVADNYPENAQIHWLINGEFVEETGNDIAVEVPQNGVVDVCAFYETPECPEGVYWCTAIDGENCEEDCPEEIWYDVDGCHLSAEIGSFVEGAEVAWNFGDGTIIFGGHYEEHSYEEPGYYQVTAFYSSPLCPDGVELWTEDLWVGDCDNPCELDVTFVDEDCNWYVFTAANFPENADIHWTLNGNLYQYIGNEIAIEVEPNIVNEVCAFYETPECPEGVFWCISIDGENCEEDCPEEIWYEVDGCSLIAEIGWFVEGESVIWYYGDGTVEEGGHFTDHIYTDPGYYQLCAYYTSPICPEGVELCTWDFYVEGCDEECTPVTFAIDAYVEEGAPNAVTWELSNLEGTFNGSGVAQFSAEDPFYDGEACLPDGCYTMAINTMGNDGEITLENVFSGFFIDGEQVSYVYGPEVMEGTMLYTFGINSDCGQESCTLEVEAIPQEDSSWYFEAFPSDEDALVIWNFGDGTDASGLVVPHIFENPGIYEVCAYFETDECPEGVLQCVTVVVGEGGDCTAVNIILSALEPIEEDMIIGWALEGDGETQYGELTLHADCQSTVLNLCLINGCYVLEMSLPGGEESVPMWMNLMINNQMSEQLYIEPGTQSVVMDFGINTDCFNSVEELTSQAAVFPIPARDQVQVITGAQTAVRWTLTALNGATVMSENNESLNFVLPVGHLAEGMYILNLFMDDRVERHRIQVMK